MSVGNYIKKIANASLSIFMPLRCLSCSKIISPSEQNICIACQSQLVSIQIENYTHNSLTDFFSARIDLIYAVALYYFEQDTVIQHLLHQLKYGGQKHLGLFFGRQLGVQLQTNIDIPIDYLCPVPVHKKRLVKRGYNQSALFGESIANSIHTIYLESLLIKTKNTKSQITKSKWERWQHEKNVFEINPNIDTSTMKDKHIAIVDDLITTGNTIENCAAVLTKNIQGVRISVFAIAKAL